MNEHDFRHAIVHDEDSVRGFFFEYRWLSNFHPCEVFFEGLMYPSSENAYQAAKFPKEFRDPFTGYTPEKSKKEGRKLNLSHSMEMSWECSKVSVMERIILDKFTRNQDLGRLLNDTGHRYLEETNWWGDRFWGADEAGQGSNHLGCILMSTRKQLRGQQERFR